MWCHTLSSFLAQTGWEQDWSTAHLQAFVSISSNIYLLTCVFLSVIPSMPAKSNAFSAVFWRWGNEASFSFPFLAWRSVPLLWHGHPGRAHTFDVFLDVLNSIKHLAQVTVKCHAEKMHLLKYLCWKTELKILTVERQNQTKTPQPQTLRGEQQKKIVTVKQDSARIFHGWTARTICQVALKDFAQMVTVPPEIRVRPVHWERSKTVSRES